MDKKVLAEAFEKFLGEDVSEKTIQKFIEIVAKKFTEVIDKEFKTYKDKPEIITQENPRKKTTQVFLKFHMLGRMRGNVGDWHREQNATAVFNTMEHTARELENNVMIKNNIVAKINFPEKYYKLSDKGKYLTVLIMEYSRVQKDEPKEKNTKNDVVSGAISLLKKSDYDFWKLLDTIQSDGTITDGKKSGNLGAIDPTFKNELVKTQHELNIFRNTYDIEWVKGESLDKFLNKAESLFKNISVVKNKFNKDELLKKAKKLTAE